MVEYKKVLLDGDETDPVFTAWDKDHADLTNVTADQHHNESHNAASHSDITSTGAQIDDAVSKKHTQGTDTTLGNMTAVINMNTHKINNVVDPALNQDAATKKYVDDTAAPTPPAGNNGEVQFNDAGSFGADSNLFWDDTNKRLGIGDTTPSYELDVNGRMRSTLGRVPAGTLHGNAVSEDVIFDSLSPSMDLFREIIVNGGITVGGFFWVISYAIKTSATTIVLYYTSLNATGSVTMTDGGANTYYISIAW